MAAYLLRFLLKEGRVTWFVGDDNYFSHPADDSAGHHLALRDPAKPPPPLALRAAR